MIIKNKGFTLIEVMIVVAIITILASVAYPAYTSHVDRSRRAEAMSALVEMSGILERYFTANAVYTNEIQLDANQNGLGLSDNLSETSQYTLAITSNGPVFSVYTITATPNNWVDNLCGSFILSNTGVREVSGDFDGDGQDGDGSDPDAIVGGIPVADVADIDDINACWR
jgi:type IV pilus assembly protein PilE